MESRRDRFEEAAPGLIEPLRRFLARRTDPATAEDVLAETLLVCWRRVDELPEPLLPWAYGVARNCLRNAERSVRREQRLVARIATVDPPTESTPESTPESADAADAELAAALASLRPDDAELLRMWAWDQLTAAEIATVLGITANAAGIRLHRARQRLRSELRKSGAASGHEGSREGRRP